MKYVRGRTLKEEKQYVLSCVEKYLNEHRSEARHNGEYLKALTDKELDSYILKANRYRSSYCSWERKDTEQVEIPVNGNIFFKFYNDAPTLLKVRTNIRSAYANHTDTISKPSMKPTGKPIATIIEEMEAEVKAFWDNRKRLKESYEYYTGNGLRIAQAEYKKWKDILHKVDFEGKKLNSLESEFRNAYGRYKAPSYRELCSKVDEEAGKVNNMEETALRRKEEIKEQYPSLYKEMFGGQP